MRGISRAPSRCCSPHSSHFRCTAPAGLFGTLPGIVASWFLQPQLREEHRSIDALRDKIEQLRALVQRLEGGSDKG